MNPESYAICKSDMLIKGQNPSKTKNGYEINFTKYFYEFKPLRALADIKADMLALEAKTVEMEKTVLD